MYERASRAVDVFTAVKTFIRGQATLRTRKVAIPMGNVLTAASVLGLITLGAASSAAKAGGNTGTGTFVLDGSTPVLARAKTGIYTLRCITAAANSGTFRLEDPDGQVLGDVTITPGAGGTVVLSEHIKGTLTDGGTDFIVGDGFDVTVAAPALVNGLDTAKLAVAAAVDGSQEPSLVLAYDVDASSAAVEAIAYESGDFVKEQLVLGAGLTLSGIREGLRRRNITFG